MAQAKPLFDQLNLICRDLERSLAFYRRLGVEIPDAAVWRRPSGAHHAAAQAAADAGVALEFDSVAFAPHWISGWQGRADLAGRVVLGFGVATREAVDALYAEMTGAGYRGLQPPYDAFWGARYAVIEDPDNIAVGLMSPVAPEKRAAPPAV